jgi:sulfur carrier protein
MNLVVNGRPAVLEEPSTIAEALARLGWDPAGRGIAVAVNGEVVPRPAGPTTSLAEADRVEVLGAVQGG